MTDEDELSLRIGRIAQAHVQIDHSIRNIYVSFASPGLAVFLANDHDSTKRLIDDCRVMLKKSGVRDEVHAAADAVLLAALDAGVKRNRAVHDMWMRDIAEGGDPSTWLTMGKQRGGLGFAQNAGPRDLASLDADLEVMQRTYIRLHGLSWTLWDVLPAFKGSRGSIHEEQRDADLTRWLAVMRDQFVVNADGSFVPLDDDDVKLT